MAETNEGTATPAVEAQSTPATEAPAAEAAPATGTPPQVDEVTTLRSRTAGLDAKVTALMTEAAAAKAAASEAAKKLADYEAGRVSGDEALRAQLAAKEAELIAVRRESTLANVQAKFPETFAVFGETAASMSETQLVEAEARFKGVPAESHTPPTPVGNNAARPAAATTKSIEEMTAAELRAYAPEAFKGLTWEAISQGD